MLGDAAPDWAALDAARHELGLSVEALWVAYVSIGGNASPSEVRGWLCGESVLHGRDGNLLAQALHDETIERGDSA